MDLFNVNADQNKLPFDGEVLNYGFVLNPSQCNYYFNTFFIADFWAFDKLVMFGKQIETKRKVAWFGNDAFDYIYAGTQKKALKWTPELLQLKEIVEQKTGLSFNSCLLNLYHNGNEGMGWHQDNEKELGVNPAIASLSLGATRKFSFKHIQTKQKVDLFLEAGTLLLMKGATQEKWMHSLPKTKNVQKPRINLTFRCFSN
ncbi:alpha-ketoglutarate-dependent dioxygenase AlkB [Lutibacter sp. HS1-25]|uniref:alpha-ketoglutarate-dependent dioxygenase AlkB family protein n=1 Tax=Lutibacter sp. HS1-25 TaxID=2485000 RepID=UPI001013B0F7|nr:alpha-ketoglutarate-dependent dioxygenase AlkB [Lutibacter sp. HS1-25]RXP44577.1 alpha-ketoglutarate-dependent dioxygenase AlkB [Lutibacter sp. HS1-25]